MLTRLEAFISGMVFMMPGFTSPINSTPVDVPEHWSPTSYVQQFFGAGRDDIKLCSNRLDIDAATKQFSVRLPMESAMGEIIHKDWQYFVLDPNTAGVSNFSQLKNPPEEQSWSITDRYIAGHQDAGDHCLNPLQSPWSNKPSYVM